ncbi:methyltransferase family protein [Allostreptomyces psammosilenae]|uniref:Protein-S-isoprenylcysteine O-methyltransferase Ste14 n=1 Tax=Allostreptomyces psammosilenae TaxID=1892865 RepID=A0A853A220_9ACTN|nr:isoprenylcysteine carboxylmethyltransferase family protein [Allostreptomyces psammosilenae]NYI04821.1 protein-S-isoprenylcysteine O-methyltransferase Ste14 [Allostreptomyces psammosilenae]
MEWWRRLRALMLPITMAGIIPGVLLWAFGGWSVDASPTARLLAAAVGVALALAGLAMLVWTVTLFERVGRGTLGPWDPPTRLVLRGPYRHVRNPMMTGVLAMQLGEAVALRSWPLAAWFLLFGTAVVIAVPVWEEPRLAERFGAEYARYRGNVPRWLPRPRAWHPPAADGPAAPGARA